MKKELAWKKRSFEEVEGLSSAYISFLNRCKTERECVKEIKRIAEENGFVDIEKIDHLKDGDKVYSINRSKDIVLTIAGEMSRGLRVIASHIDSPRLDLKQNPLYEDEKLVLLETHYYGGVRKYQWVGIPLALHGIVITKEGKTIDIVIGESDGDGTFTIADLPPHLGKKQNELKLSEAITGESLDLLAGNSVLEKGGEKEKEEAKEKVLEVLNERYGIAEEDFVRAEIEVVPAINARPVGFDKSMVGGYGQDDRMCAFASLQAIKEVEKGPIMALFVDKEEIGSDGATGMNSVFFENFVSDLIDKSESDIKLRNVLSSSKAISADGTAGVTPNYKDVQELKNASKIGYGVSIEKFTGSGGKYGASDASAEYVAEVISIFERNGVNWQSGEIGKVDIGGGGTVAKFLAKYNMDVLDVGPALLGMHSPFEVSSKVDLYETYRGYLAFLRG
jgi:Aspartyl aminopeptidase